MKFSEVAKIFDQIERESSRTEITKLLAGLFAKATPAEAAILAYISLGELNPVYVGTQFNMAEKSIISAIAELLSVSESTIARHAKQKGDLGLVLADEWRGGKGDLTLIEVNKALHEIHDISGAGSSEKKQTRLVSMLQDLDAAGAKYVVRIILGKLRMGYSDMTLLDAFSWMEVGDKSLREPLEDAYNVTADIGYIIKTLKEASISGIKKIHIVPGIPIRPAAAERLASAEAIVKKLSDCIAQPKLDGFRLQVHLYKDSKGRHVRFFSRNLQDMSEMFPELKKATEALNVTSLVADGEAISYDHETGTFLPFQETVKRKRKYDIEQMAKDFPLRLYLFDLLYLDGRSLLDLPHQERRKKLEKLTIKDPKQVIYLIDEVEIKAGRELEEYFNSMVTAGLEGLVVKKPDAPYKPGKRNFNWIKFKRHETGELEDTIDCVILGYYSGHGKRASFGIGAFLVGIYNAKEDSFQTIAKIGTGLSDEGWRELRKRCDQIAIDKKPKNVDCAKELEPDLWVSPEIVCSIRADEITLSPLHKAGASPAKPGYALRFPRIMGYREDKSATEATEIKEIKELYELQFEKKVKAAKKQ